MTPTLLPNELLATIEAAETEHLSLYGGEAVRVGPLSAVYTGPELPVNGAWGFGSHSDGLNGHLDAVEEFFAARHLPSRLVVYSHFPAWATLAERGYRLAQLLHVHVHSLEDLPEWMQVRAMQVRASPPDEFAALSARAFGPGNEAIMERTARRTRTRFYAAEVAGEPVAAGAMTIFGAVAWLFSAATLPEFRNMGAQTALLAARLHAAKDAGASRAAVLTTPGSASERNVQRAGFVQVGARLSFQQG
ncbi:GNAT family N-acetyltransferase [Deinococcus altitudinis]|uniref:GNAT family N-acetyltransferase n=1 Tax=Deinococcus altitudinis TaxID=468914 RepID=UPI003891732E